MKISKLLPSLALVTAVIATSSCGKLEDRINSLEQRISELENTRIPSIDEQVASIKKTIGELEKTDAGLREYISALEEKQATLETELGKTNAALTEAQKTLREEMDADKTELSGSIDAAKADVIAQLEAYKTLINGELETLNGTIESLKAKDEELQKNAEELRSYVDSENGKVRDWADATFATLEQQNKLAETVASIKTQFETLNSYTMNMDVRLTNKAEELSKSLSALDESTSQQIGALTEKLGSDISSLRTELTDAYTKLIATEITKLETSIKSWVNEQLAGYYTIAETDAKLEVLKTAQNNGDTELASAIKELDASLTQAKADIKDAYEKAISEAITKCEGKINAKIAADIATATDVLKRRIDAIDIKITSIETRIKALEDRLNVIERQKVVTDITDISYIPEYSDGKSAMWYCESSEGKIIGGCDTLHFEIHPMGTVEKLLASPDVQFKVHAVYSKMVKSSCVNMVELPILGLNAEDDILMVVVSGEKLRESFFLNEEGVACRLLISVDDVEKTSGYVPMRPVLGDEHRAYFVQSSISMFVGGTIIPEITRIPVSAPLKFESSNKDVITVTSDGKVTGVGVGNAILSITTISGFTQSIPVNVISSSLSINLSENGTANSYIVPFAGTFSFKANVKGNSTEVLEGTPVTAAVLWESFGTDELPEVGDLISSVSYVNGNIVFKTPDVVKNGNASIAVKDAMGKILWSWHIWICKGYNPIDYEQVYNNDAGIMMDRNLGATSAASGDVGALGLFYQWGRKDPFLGAASVTSNVSAASTIKWPDAVQSKSSSGTILYATEHPTTFITINSNNDWYYYGDWHTGETRWQSEKTLYDPCPVGWRVPDGGERCGIWAQAFGVDVPSIWTTVSNWDGNGYGMDFSRTDRTLGSDEPIWYPASGDISYGAKLEYVGKVGYYWTVTRNNNYVYNIYFNHGGIIQPWETREPAAGYSVRCQKDE